MSTAPPDVVLTNTPCTSAQKVNNYDCYRIQAALTATIFYLPITRQRELAQEKEEEKEWSPAQGEEEFLWWLRTEDDDRQNYPQRPYAEEYEREAHALRRRLLNTTSTILDTHVYNSFNKSLQTIFASGSLTGPTVKTVTFLGITNDASGEGGGGVSAVQRSGNQAHIAGGVVGTLAAVALIGVLAFVWVKQHRQSRAKDSELIHPHLDESASDLSLQLGAAPPPSQSKAAGAPEMQEQYMPIESEVFDLDTATLDDEDEESRVKQSMGLKMSYETDDDDDEQSSAAKRDPMFVPVRPDLSDAHALADMKQRIQDEFGASAYQKSRIKRKYTVGDTVAL